jgi:uncharacterized alkaline shock family protein YloU
VAEPAAGVALHQADDPGARGRLTISDRAVQRLAVAAAREVPEVAPPAAGLTSYLHSSYPRADVTVAGKRVRARIEVEGRWPSAAAVLADDVRTMVAGRLHELAGLRVDAVDVVVAGLVRTAEPGRRVR